MSDIQKFTDCINAHLGYSVGIIRHKNWKMLDFEKELFVKVRSTGKLIKANINFNKDIANIKLLEDEYGISPGQACVFYSKNSHGDKVLGGGWITKTDNNYLSTELTS